MNMILANLNCFLALYAYKMNPEVQNKSFKTMAQNTMNHLKVYKRKLKEEVTKGKDLGS